MGIENSIVVLGLNGLGKFCLKLNLVGMVLLPSRRFGVPDASCKISKSYFQRGYAFSSAGFNTVKVSTITVIFVVSSYL